MDGTIAGNKVICNRSFTIKNPIVLITADGRTLLKDIERFLAFKVPHDVYCVARSYKAIPGRMNHWANVDSSGSKWWAEHLPPNKIYRDTIRHTHGDVNDKEPGFDVNWDVIGSNYDPRDVRWHGSTSLFAVYTAIAMGYKKLVLAGSPLDTNGHWYDPPNMQGPQWDGETYRAWLDFAKAKEGKMVKSLSGYTAQILGEPTSKWLRL